MEKYTNKYEVALAIAEKFGSTNDHLSNIFEALLEIGQLRGLSVEGYSNKYEILRALALNEGVTGPLSNMYECLVGLAGIYGGTNFSNNYEAALYLLENAEAGFGGLSFTAVTAGAIGMSHHGTNASTTKPNLQYSRDGETWTDWNYSTLMVNAGDKLYLKGINNTISSSNVNYSNFALTGSFKASGNIMSLLYGDDYKEKVSLANKNYCFYGLFYGTKGILTSPKLPATTLSTYCYAYMFNGTNLATMPELPATTLTYRCYYNMFANCKSLTATTKLPAKKLVEDCYRGMFNECTSLNSVRADFNVMPTADYTEAWLNDVASEGTFYVASDAAWIDDVEFGPDTIPVGWTISGRVPHRKVNVTIDGVVYRLPEDQTFAQLGYTELYSQENYYPRFGQTAHDFTYNINSHPMSGLELFTTCVPAVHMINVTVDGAATQANYYTSWFANGFNLLYADNEFESESEVEEIDVDTTYPNEGDTVYTSYIIVPQWMKQVSAQTSIPVINLYNANNNYRFVDYLRSTGTQYIVTDITLQTMRRFEALTNIMSGVQAINGAFYRSGSTGSNYNFCEIGTTSAGLYLVRGGKDTSTAIVPNVDIDNNYHKFAINRNDSTVHFDSNTYSLGTATSTTAPANVVMNLFARSNNGTNGNSCGTQNAKYFIIEDATAAHYFIPVINASNQAVMLDLTTMREFANDGTGAFEYGDTKSLESKFNEMGYGLTQWMYDAATQYDLLPEKIWEASNIDADVKKSFDGSDRRLRIESGADQYFDAIFTISNIRNTTLHYKIQRDPTITTGRVLFSSSAKTTTELIQNGYNGYFRFGNGRYNSSIPTDSPYIGDNLEFVATPTKITAYKDGVQIHTAAPNVAMSSAGAFGTLALFHSTQTTTTGWMGWLSYFEAEDDASRVFLIPIINNGVVTLYDLIAGKALTPQGTQNFTIE